MIEFPSTPIQGHGATPPVDARLERLREAAISLAVPAQLASDIAWILAEHFSCEAEIEAAENSFADADAENDQLEENARDCASALLKLQKTVPDAVAAKLQDIIEDYLA